MTNPASQQPAPPSELELVANMLEEVWGLPESAGYVRSAEARIARLEAALRKVSRYHHDTCDQMLSPGARYACSCGKAEFDAALSTPLGTPGRDKP